MNEIQKGISKNLLYNYNKTKNVKKVQETQKIYKSSDSRTCPMQFLLARLTMMSQM